MAKNHQNRPKLFFGIKISIPSGNPGMYRQRRLLFHSMSLEASPLVAQAHQLFIPWDLFTMIMHFKGPSYNLLYLLNVVVILIYVELMHRKCI
jgi:hypothetical protein